MQEQEQVKLCKQIITDLYNLASMNNEIFGAMRYMTPDEKVHEALDILVFNGYVAVDTYFRVRLTELGVGAYLFGFENADKILKDL
jgi:hypothetical protein